MAGTITVVCIVLINVGFVAWRAFKARGRSLEDCPE